MKYLRCTNSIHPGVVDYLKDKNPSKVRSGVYLWLDVFKGDVKLYQDVEDFEDYDVVHVNLCGMDLQLVNNIRDKLPKSSSTKIVANLDYSIEETQIIFQHPDIYQRAWKGADHYYNPEAANANLVEEVIGEKCHVIPNPINNELLAKHRKTTRENVISIVYHYYDDQIDVPYWATKNLGLKTRLVNYQKGNRARLAQSLFNEVYKFMPYEEWVKVLSYSKIVYEPYIMHSYGRATAEAACLGVPSVGSFYVDSMRRCFPELCCDPMDIKNIRANITKLNENIGFYQDVSNRAYEASKYYWMDNCKKMFLNMLEGK